MSDKTEEYETEKWKAELRGEYESRGEMIDLASMFYWWPKIKDLKIPQPRTVMVPFTEREYTALWNEEGFPTSVPKRILKAVQQHGFTYPLFLRTDQTSAKHYWNRTCYITKEAHINSKDRKENHLLELFEFNNCAGVFGLPFIGVAIRELIRLQVGFTAFYGKLPIGAERRYFISDGAVVCHHPYWIEAAIQKPSIKNWKRVLADLNEEHYTEVALLTEYAWEIAQQFEGNWSVDFCRGTDGKWWLIDMATAHNSWHPDCEHKGAFEKDAEK